MELLLTIAPVAPEHEMLLFTWAKDPTVRAMSFSSAPIPLPEHRRWFAQRMNDPNCRLYLVGLGDTPVGLVRFTRDGAFDWELGVTLDPAARGQGLAAPALALGCQRLVADTGATRITARTRPQNEAFRRAAKRVGFVEQGPCSVNGQEAVRLSLVPGPWSTASDQRPETRDQ